MTHDLSFRLAEPIDDLDLRSLMLQSRSEPQRLKLFADFVDGYISRRDYVALMKKKAPTKSDDTNTAYDSREPTNPERWQCRWGFSGIFGLMYMPPINLSVPQQSPSEYQQAFAGKEDKIVWYKFKELPSITPPSTPKAHRELRAEVKAKQAVVSSPKNAPKRDQVVISPVPDIELPPLDLPNLIAVKLPPKAFTTPPDVIKPAAEIPVPDGPQEVAAQDLGPVNLPTERLPGKTFVPPPTREALPKPEIKIAEFDAAPIRPLVASAIPTEKLPARAYVPPTARPVEPRRTIPTVTDAERPEAIAPIAASLPSEKLPSRAFVPPPPPKKEPAQKPELPQPIDGPPGDVTIAIAGLNPALTAPKLPVASSPAQFSAGQKVNPEGATSDGSGKGIIAADLYAHSEEKPKPIFWL